MAVTNPGGLNDAFLHNGLGQRTAKTDSTGQYALVSDGAAPAAPVLADGVTVYTPGLSSRKSGNSSEFRHGDLLGSLRFLTDANQTVVGDRLFSAFGATVASDGDPSTPFGWVGDGESQTDADTGLVLMGHRVYDSRLGRFLSQDPAGDGNNWYAYCGNNPVSKSDPSGLWCPTPTVENSSGSWAASASADADARTSNAMADMDMGLEVRVLLANVADKSYKTKDGAATAALDAIYQRSVTEQWEYHGMISEDKDGKFHITDPFQGKSKLSIGGDIGSPPVDCVGIYHTHPPECVGHDVDPTDFSDVDKKAADSEIGTFPSFQSYIETPNDIRRYTPVPNRPMHGRDDIIRRYSIYNP